MDLPKLEKVKPEIVKRHCPSLGVEYDPTHLKDTIEAMSAAMTAAADVSQCTRCGGDSDSSLDECPYCGEGEGGAPSEAAPERPEREDVMYAATDLADVVEQVLRALRHDETIYQRGGHLVTISSEAAPPKSKKAKKSGVQHEGPRIVGLGRFSLTEALSRNIDFYCNDEKSEEVVPIGVPSILPRVLLERPQYPSEYIRPLVGLSNGPVLHEDGGIYMGPGYDAETGLYVTNAVDVDVPELPKREDAVAAVALLRSAVRDFPFAGEEHFSAWLAALLTLAARHLVEGCTPMIAIDANVRGAGKGLLCDVASIIALGRALPRASEPTDNAETRKVLTSIALAGHVALLFDNVEHTLDSPQLANVITAERWQDRVLGVNKDVNLPWRTVLLCTGNNLGFSSDLLRRVLHIRLESPLEQPEERSDVEHVDLRGYVRQHRGELLSAVLTILRTWLRAGMPAQGLTPWGSFEGWSRVIRECVVWLGLPDPAATRQELQRSGDTEASALRTLLESLVEIDPQGEGLTTQQIIGGPDDGGRWGAGEDHGYQAPLLADALAQLCPGKPGRPLTAQTLGYRLRRLKGRVVNGLALDSVRSMHGARWVVRRVGPAGGGHDDHDDHDDAPSPPTRARVRDHLREPSSSSASSSWVGESSTPSLPAARAIPSGRPRGRRRGARRQPAEG